MRLFVAVNLPPEVRRAVWESAAPLHSAHYPVRWVGVESLHLTLKFLGELSADRETEVIAALDEAVAGTEPFTLPIGGFGAFPSPRRARVVWVGCEAVPALELVQRRLEERTGELGFPREDRPFHPHLTLGRVRRDTRVSDLEGLGAALQQLEFGIETKVESVDLMQSELTRAGARYATRHLARLAE